MNVEYVDHMGTDLTIVNAARVSLGRRSEELNDADRGLIRYLMREKHASPFEHCSLTVLVDAPIAVAREWMRHRTQSYNEFSTRYSEVKEPQFYVPSGWDMRTQVGKPGAYTYVPMPLDASVDAMQVMSEAYTAAEDAYTALLDLGVAREVARNVLPLGMHTTFYATANLRNWLNFLHLRLSGTALREIRVLADKVDNMIAQRWPETHNAWCENGRQAL